jgi:hypothetical protein
VSEGVYVERKIANCLLVGPNGSGKSLWWFLFLRGQEKSFLPLLVFVTTLLLVVSPASILCMHVTDWYLGSKPGWFNNELSSWVSTASWTSASARQPVTATTTASAITIDIRMAIDKCGA